MANQQNIEKHKFQKGQSGNPAGKPPGIKNRSSVARKWLEATEKYINPLTLEEGELTQEDIITLEQIKEARYGKNKTQAYTALMDSGFGKAITSISVDPESSVHINWQNTFKPPEKESAKPTTKAKKK